MLPADPEADSRVGEMLSHLGVAPGERLVAMHPGDGRAVALLLDDLAEQIGNRLQARQQENELLLRGGRFAIDKRFQQAEARLGVPTSVGTVDAAVAARPSLPPGRAF